MRQGRRPMAIVSLHDHQCDLNMRVSQRWCCFFSFLLTVKTLTSVRLRTSSTRPSGFPLGTGMVPRTVKEEPSSICRTALMKDWLKSSILPISSMTKTLLLPPSAGATWGKWGESGVGVGEARWDWGGLNLYMQLRTVSLAYKMHIMLQFQLTQSLI